MKALIFDVGGVLVRTEDRSHRQRLAEELGLSVQELYDAVFHSDAWRLAELGRITNDEHWQAVGRRLGLSRPDEVNAFRAAFFAGDRLDRDLLAFIQQLRGRYKVALLSNAPDSLRRWIADEWHIPADTFDAIVASAEVGLAKPDPAIYRIALERLGVAPHDALFVDDFAENVEAARALGMEAIHFTSPEALMAELGARVEAQS